MMDKQNFIALLEKRFNQNMHRHKAVSFDAVIEKLSDEAILNTLWQMEESGGEPDVFEHLGMLYYVDFSKETPKGRISICYDKEARTSRKKFPPETSAQELADKMGVKLIDEQTYQAIQKIEDLDLKTSSWLLTPNDIRTLGGAIFGDKRYGRTFIYHNGADSYYGVRGFRGILFIGTYIIYD